MKISYPVVLPAETVPDGYEIRVAFPTAAVELNVTPFNTRLEQAYPVAPCLTITEKLIALLLKSDVVGIPLTVKVIGPLAL